MSTTTFTHDFNTQSFKGKLSFPTGIFIDGQFSAGSNGTTIEYVSTVLFGVAQYISHSRLVASSTPVS